MMIDPNASAEELEKALRILAFTNLISADNDTLNEETKQEIIRRYDDRKKTDDQYDDWEVILEPIKDDNLRIKYLNILD